MVYKESCQSELLANGIVLKLSSVRHEVARRELITEQTLMASSTGGFETREKGAQRHTTHVDLGGSSSGN